MATLAIVVSLVGKAWAENADGERRALEVGDRLGAEETLIMAEGARIDLDFGDNQQLTFLGEQQVTAQAREDLAEEADSLAPLEERTESGTEQPRVADEGASAQGHSFVQLVRIGEIIEADGITPVTVARIQEVLRPMGLSLPQAEFERYEPRETWSSADRHEANDSFPETGSKLSELSISVDVIAGDDIVDATEAQQTITLSGTVGGGVQPGDTVTVTVNGQSYETTVNADGKTWQVDVPGSELAQDNNVQAIVDSVEPNGTPVSAETERPYEVDNATPDASVELKGAGPDGIYNESEIVDDKVPGEVTLGPNTEPGDTIVVTDGKGNELINRPVTQDDIDNGIIVDVPVEHDQSDVEVNVELTDPTGNTSSATDSKPVDAVPPQLSIEIEGEGSTAHYDAAKITNGQAKVTVKLTAGTVKEGDQLVVTDGNGNIVIDRPVTQAEVTSGEVDVLLSVAQGQQAVNVEAVITDPAGNSGNDTDSKVILSPELAIDSAQVDNAAGTIDISGNTTDVAPNTDVEITITDHDGNQVTTTAMTDTNGDYSVTGTDISGLTDGPLEIKAETTDHNGNPINDTATDALDHVAGDLTVDTTIVDDVGQAIDIEGSTTDVSPGEEVTITIKDQDGTEVTTTTTVNPDGSYDVSGTDISSLVDGPLEITAESTDNNGNPVSGTGVDAMDNLAGDITVAFTNDPIADPALAEVTGSTTDVAPGETVNLTFTDVNGQTTTATAVVANDGTYTTTVDLRGLTDGDITVDATATDRNSDPVNATDNAELDAVAADIVIDTTSVDDGAGTIDISGSTTDVAEGADVKVTITDQNNISVDVTVQTDANGNYTVTEEDISGLTDGPLDIKAETKDHNGNDIDDTANDVLDHVAGDITVDEVTVDNTAEEVVIEGSTDDVPENAQVDITITDSEGNTATGTATVGSNGEYTSDNIDTSGLVDGDFTVDVKTTDNNGNEVTGESDGATTGSTELDQIDGAITVEFTENPVVDAAVTKVTGTTTDVARGEEVTLTFTSDNGGAPVVVTAVVATDGTYNTKADLRDLTDGNVTVDAEVVDRNGGTVSDDDTVVLDAVTADITIDTTTVNDTTGEIDITGSTTDVAPNSDVGITITDKDSNTVTVTVQTDANGNYTVTGQDIKGLTDGPLDIKAETEDHNGNTINDIATDAMDHVAGDLTVDTTTVNDAGQTIDIEGSTTDVHPGETVTITIKDQDGTEVTTTTTVNPNGSYEVTGEDISSLVDGPLEITAESTDNNGDPMSGTGNDAMDNLAGDITVAFTNDPIADPSAAGVTGTTVDVAPGETVDLTFTDVNGQIRTATAVVDGSGNYSTTVDLRGLTDGDMKVDAAATDRNSDPVTATDTAEMDALASNIAIDTTTVDDTAGTIDISGSTTDVAPNSDVGITITDKDSNTVTVTVQTDANGNYTVTGQDIKGLTDGPLDIKAETEDHNGNTINDTATDAMDHVSGDLTVDTTTVDDAGQTIDIAGSTTDVSPGEEVTVTIKDQDGNEVTKTTTVNPDGNYDVSGTDISSLVDGPLGITAESTDNNGNSVNGTGNDGLDNLAGDITVEFATDPITDAAVTEVTGTTTDVAPGEEVTLTFTDQNGDTTTAIAVVDSSGEYTTTVDLRGLTDGDLTVDATATDRNNDPVNASDNAELDAIAADIAIDYTNVDDGAGTIYISGSTKDVAPNSDVEITIADKDGNEVTASATTDAAGNYVVNGTAISGLTDGPLDIKAETTDHNGNTIDDTANDILDHVPGDITVDNVTVDNTAEEVVIAGSTDDVPENAQVDITITDSEGNTATGTATVGSNGEYTSDNIDTSGLVDGDFTVDVKTTDNNGNEVTGESDGNTTGDTELDQLDGDLTVGFDAAIDAENAIAVPVSGTTDDVAAGDDVTLTFTSSNGGTPVVVTTTVAAGGTYSTKADLRGLTDGDITVDATATDRNGEAVSDDDAAIKDALAAEIAIDTTTVDDTTGEIDITGSTTDVAEGTDVVVTITDQNNVSVDVTVQTDADGNYTVTEKDIKGLTDGDLTITAETVDHNGNPIDDTATDAMDHVSGDLTVDTTTVDDGAQTVDISGSTTDVHPGEEVIITIKDQDGNEVTTTTTVNPDGIYDVTGENISSLVDGPLDITAESTDNNGNPVSGTGVDAMDNLAGDITVAFTNDPIADPALAEVTGSTTDVAPGEEVTLTFTDQNGDTTTAIAVVDSSGEYTTTVDLRGLTDGRIDVDATATDRNSDTVNATNDAVLDAVASDIAINYTSVDDGAGTIDISGSTTDVAEGTDVVVTITDQNNISVDVTVQTDANGNYTVTEKDIKGLTDGDLTITAETVDHNGNDIDDTANDVLDYVDGKITVENVTVDDDNQTVSFGGKTEDVPENATVNITVTDKDGNVATGTAVVDGDGNYRAGNIDTSGLVDGDFDIDVITTDNNGEDVDGAGNGTLDNIDDTITVNLDDITSANESAVTVSGTTTDVLPGETVDLTFTDASNSTTTATATVAQDGSYQTSVDLSGLDDGSVTVDAETTGRNGTVTDDDSANKDSTAPTLEITSTNDVLASGDVEEITFTFSEEVTGFDISDITVAGGTLTNPGTTDGGTTWTADFTADGSGNISIKVPDDSYTDVAGNLGTGDDHVINAAPTISAVDGNGGAGGHITVSDKGVDNASDNSETANGTLRVTAPTGLESITIGGTDISLVQLQALEGTPQTITITGHGELTINSFTPTAQVNGEDVQWDIDYSYELTEPQDHGSAAQDGLLENIDLGVKAESITGGSSIAGSGDLGVLVTDDIPTVDITTGVVLENIQVSEADIADNAATASKNYSDAFTKDFGADGAAATESLVYSFEVTSASGLVDTATGNDITLSVDGNGDVVGTVDGSSDIAFTITVDANGVVELTQKRAIEHSNPGTANDDVIRLPEDSVKLKATVKDSDGDTDDVSISIGNNISFVDSNPTIGEQPDIADIDEKDLPAGSEGDPTGSNPSVTKDLDIDFGADGIGSLVFVGDADGSYGQEALITALNNSGNDDIDLLVDGNTITGTRGTGASKEDVFTVTLNVDANGEASYTFELQDSIKHFIPSLDNQFSFNYRATDGDNDKVEGAFTVSVIDDAPKTKIEIETNEDTAFGPFTISADARPDNIEIKATETGPAIIANGDGSFTVAHGTVSIAANGTITYTPDDDYSNHDNLDHFYVTVAEDNGPPVTTEVEVNVVPVADAPELEANKEVTTNEDVSIALDLQVPIISDANDQNGTTAGDDPERLGEITLSLTGDAIGTLTNASDVAYTDNSNGEYKFVITDVADLHLDGLTNAADPAVNYVTQDEYEAIKAQPAGDRHENFDVEVSVKSYEVDASGVPLDDADVGGTNGAESTQTITVDVHAVTDEPELDLKETSYTFDEDTVLDLTNELVEGFDDTDGSEEFWYEVEGLEPGTVVVINGESYTADGTGKIDSSADKITVDAADKNPKFTIKPPQDFSGDMDNVKITLNVQDSDDDSPSATPSVESKEVTVDLHVNPIAGDIEITAGNVSTDEDTAVDFLKNIQVTDTNDGVEVIAQVEFELPTGWKLTGEPAAGSAGDAVWTVTGDGSAATPYIIEFTAGTEANREAALKEFEITPPAHSSKDEDITVKVTTTDTNTVDGSPVTDSSDTSFDITVNVAPVAEEVGSSGDPSYDTDGDGNPDLTMMDDYTYKTDGEEDEWFDLGTDSGEFQFSEGWSNQDASEDTYAVLTPSLFEGDGTEVSAVGAKFQWDGGSATYTGDPIEVPIGALDSLEFKATKDFAGTFEINVQAKTVDVNADDPNDKVEAISGEATLKSGVIKPVADTATTSLTARVNGNEDEPMGLSIRPNSTDPNEIFDVTLDSIPVGATLTYGDYTITKDGAVDSNNDPVAGITVSSDGTGEWEIEFKDFDKNEDMTITPPLDSNDEFTLGVSTVTVDEIFIPDDINDPTGSGTTYTDRSDPESLDMIISPKGVADPAEFELSTNLEYTEAVAESTGINVSDLIAKAELKDDDGSEKLTFKLGNLPAGFEVEGATLIGGTGADREWSFNQGNLGDVVIKAPANYNGIVDFNIYTITTENDGDSLTREHDVQLTITPTPEAEMNLSASIDEDVSTALDFSVVHQNGDDDESISKVWINVDSVKDGLQLTLGDGGPALSTKETIGSDEYYVVEKGDLNNIYAQGAANWHGTTDFDVKYEVTDPGNDGLADVTAISDGKYTVEVGEITDQVTLGITSGAETTLNEAGAVNVALNVGNDGQEGGDYDGSEMLTRIIVEGVPEGVILTNPGSHLGGDGTWVLEVNEKMDGGALSPELSFDVHGSAGGLTDHEMTVTVVSKDAGNGQETTATDTIKITTNFDQGGGENPAEIKQWEQTDFEPTEDTDFTLDKAINAEIDDTGVSDNSFTVTLKDLPEGTTVDGMTRTVVNDEEIWSATGTGGDDELQALLKGITVTAPADFNSNKGQFKYNATLTTHVPSGGRAEADTAIDQTVTPVTDNAEIVITAPAVDEGNNLEFNIDISNTADDPAWTIVDGKLYLQLDEPAELQGGKLMDGNTELSTSAVSNVGDIPDGDYYVVDLNGAATKDLTYAPKAGNEYRNGDVTLKAWVQSQEKDAANTVTTQVSQAGTINPVNNGYNLTVDDVTGDENPTASDKEQAIRINVGGTGLVDDDGSEEIETITLKNVPNDFLVFAGKDAQDASEQKMVDNAGGDGETNTWILGNEMPEYIAILPPKHWSGTIKDLTLSVISGETGLKEKNVTEETFNLTVDPVADGVELKPTESFGNEGEIVGLNLNAKMKDLEQAGPTDQSTESVTLELKGLGEHASFYIGDALSMDDVAYDDGTDTYTIAGLSQGEIDNLGFIQANSAIGNIEVRAQSVESGNGHTSEWTDWKGINSNITDQISGPNDDTLLWTGESIDGRSGEDTIQLRFDESVTGDQLRENLDNIEVISMEGAGDNKIETLNAEDVISTTDERNVLKLLGDDRDSVSLDSGWSKGSNSSKVGFDVYTGSTENNLEATLYIQEGVDVVIE